MAHMERQIEHGEFYRVETCNGTEFIPTDAVLITHRGKSLKKGIIYETSHEIRRCMYGFLCSKDIDTVQLIEGYGALDDMYGEDEDN